MKLYDLQGKRIWVAGHRGMVGSALVRRLATTGVQLLSADRKTLDLRRQQEVEQWLRDNRPDAVFVLAATVGGWWAMHAGSDTKAVEVGEEDERHFRSHFDTHPPRDTVRLTYEDARTGYTLGHAASSFLVIIDSLRRDAPKERDARVPRRTACPALDSIATPHGS